MELLKYVREIWLRTHSKGQWHPMRGGPIYVENLEDEHLMRIPHFLWKDMGQNQRRRPWIYIPAPIIEEIEERNMYIEYDNKCIVKRNAPVVSGKVISSKFNKKPKKKHNNILFK